MRVARLCLLGVAVFFCLSIIAGATDKQTILYSFKGKTDGASPESGLVLDAAGNLYGTTRSGGTADCGMVFELSNSGGSWTEAILHTFTGGSDGCEPVFSKLIFDAQGNLYGETALGGPGIYGTIFELSPNSSGGWAETILYSFTGGADGNGPSGGLIFDDAGNLYGTTRSGGIQNPSCVEACGTVFELSPNSNGGWTETVLYAFTGLSDLEAPLSGVVFDAAGNLYGTTSVGNGVVFQLSPSSSGWAFNIIFGFGGSTGYSPQGNLVFDKAGNLYGTTGFVGPDGPYGAVWELSPPTTGTLWQPTVLHSFTNNNDGSLPLAGLIIDSWGNLYGTTRGFLGSPTAFRLNHLKTGWTFGLLHFLPGWPLAPLARDAAGNLFGTTYNGGLRSGLGCVFELSSVK